eukprot:2429089-Pyramimonas_sp.AAC.1
MSLFPISAKSCTSAMGRTAMITSWGFQLSSTHVATTAKKSLWPRDQASAAMEIWEPGFTK